MGAAGVEQDYMAEMAKCRGAQAPVRRLPETAPMFAAGSFGALPARGHPGRTPREPETSPVPGGGRLR